MESNDGYFNPSVVNDTFPREEKFECYDGTERTFIISCFQFSGTGYKVEAVEKGKNRMGYEFAAYHATHPLLALGDLRKRMHWELSKNYISKRKAPFTNGYSPLHDVLEGRITVDEIGQLVLVIDGIPIGQEDFLGMFEMHEGFKFKVSFAETSDDFPNY